MERNLEMNKIMFKNAGKFINMVFDSDSLLRVVGCFAESRSFLDFFLRFLRPLIENQKKD